MNIYTGGTFDILHRGHIALFAYCASLKNGGGFTVALNTDEFVASFKGKPPIQTYGERKAAIEQLREIGIGINTISMNDSHDSTELILRARTDIIVIGTDWLRKDYCKQLGISPEWLEKNDISLLYHPYAQGISTTEIKRRINEQ